MTFEQAIKVARRCVLLGLWESVQPQRWEGDDWVVFCVQRASAVDLETHGYRRYRLVTRQPVDVFTSADEVREYVSARPVVRPHIASDPKQEEA